MISINKQGTVIQMKQLKVNHDEKHDIVHIKISDEQYEISEEFNLNGVTIVVDRAKNGKATGVEVFV